MAVMDMSLWLFNVQLYERSGGGHMSTCVWRVTNLYVNDAMLIVYCEKKLQNTVTIIKCDKIEGD